MTRASKSRAKRRSTPAPRRTLAEIMPEMPEDFRMPYSPYHELSFITQDKQGHVTSWWSPPKIEDVDGSESAYAAQWAVRNIQAHIASHPPPPDLWLRERST